MSRTSYRTSSPLQVGDPALAAAVVQDSVDGFAVLDREGRYVLWNAAMERFTGKTADEVLGQVAVVVFPTLREHGLDVAIQRVLRGEVVATDGIEHIEPDGTRKVYDRLYTPLRDFAGDVAGVIAIVRDSTARYTALDALRTSESKLGMAAEAWSIGLWTWDPAGGAVTWDDTTCKLFGRAPGDAPKGRDEYLTLIHPDDRERSRERIAIGEAEGTWEHEFRIIRSDGAVRWLTSRTRTVRTDRGDLVLGAVFDVTERKEAEERQRAAQRLELVGQLTAGIAHNFNNILMGMLPNLQLAARSAPAALLPLLRDAEQSALRAAGVVQELMTYAGRSRTTTRRVVPLGPLVEQTVAFCRTTFDRRIELDVACRDAAMADVDESQVEQAVLNLLINARDALDDGAGAEPKISVVCETVSRVPELEGRAGAWVAIRITDNGIGMDAATAQRIFEPFFTTKPAGKGTGLGLATTQAIARNHGGFVTCRSAPGQGSTLTLYVPGRSGATTASDVRRSPVPRSRARDAKILVVDDDDQVRTATARVLRDAGFGVTTAASGDEALALVAAPSAPRFDLVVLDVSMPGLSGPQTRGRLRELVPATPVVFLTGYTFESEHGDPVLEKPLRAEALVARLDEILRA
ncbi:MAG TPA: PAS domain S-box protein [Kofleriaceae bacterium]|nr:PAS domain S-box protein [Kofleriaceae bacterium]